MSSWKYNPAKHTILNVDHGTWEIDLAGIHGVNDLLYWILQGSIRNSVSFR